MIQLYRYYKEILRFYLDSRPSRNGEDISQKPASRQLTSHASNNHDSFTILEIFTALQQGREKSALRLHRPVGHAVFFSADMTAANISLFLVLNELHEYGMMKNYWNQTHDYDYMLPDYYRRKHSFIPLTTSLFFNCPKLLRLYLNLFQLTIDELERADPVKATNDVRKRLNKIPAAYAEHQDFTPVHTVCASQCLLKSFCSTKRLPWGYFGSKKPY